MPRNLPPALLAAMDSGNFTPYLKIRLIADDPEHYTIVDPLEFKIADITAECTIPYQSAYLANTAFAIERGAMVGGAPVTIRSVYYSITSLQAGPLGIRLQGHVLPPYFSSFNGNIWYMDVIDRLVGSLGWMWDQTVTYEDDTAPWLSYLFYPSGRNLALANMQSFFNILAQKYLIFPAENMDGLFIFQATTARAKDYDITDERLSRETCTISRRFVWRDEAMTVHYSGSPQDPLHNLGYIDSLEGAAPANAASPRPFKSSKLPVHLKYRTGDVAKLGTATNYFQGRIKVTEVFDPKSTPSWHVLIEPLCWFHNTEGGALPSTIEAAAPYTPLHTGTFNNVLSTADNNIQAAMETLDDHTHAHANLTGIGTNTHTQIDTFITSKAQANGLASLDANGAVPWAQVTHKYDLPGIPALPSDEHFFALPAWTGWVNDPLEAGKTAGAKYIANHYGQFQATDETKFSLYYRNISTYSNKYAVMVGIVGGSAEVGLHIDDGTLNNYVEFGLTYVSVGIVKFIKRVCTTGTPVVTDLLTNQPAGFYGMQMNYGSSLNFYFFKDSFLQFSLGGAVTAFFTPARLGFHIIKSGTGSGKQVGIVRWTDNFS